MQHIIIFGAGETAEYLYELASFVGYYVVAFIDNDAKKWGSSVREVEIFPPEKLKDYRCKIVINDKYFPEISAQLEKTAYRGEVISRTELFDEMVTKNYNREDFARQVSKESLTYVIDSYFWKSDWGGVESWSCMVDYALKKKGCRTAFFCGNNRKFDNVVEDCIHFCGRNEIEDMRQMIDGIISQLPCVVLSHASAAFFAAVIVKNMYPEKIKIVMAIHADADIVYERIARWVAYIDYFICISNKIARTAVQDYGMRAEKVAYHVNPMQLSEKKTRKENWEGRLKIGFAARLHKTQKRAHLLPQIIDDCFKRGLDVEFNIAGEGDCFGLLKSYILEYDLSGKVHLLGWLSPTEMADFWGKQDIYLNISDYEGMSLTMLEAMAYGAVPVVTDVSGVEDVIVTGQNGFVIPTDQWMECVDKIAVLEHDRELLAQGSRYNMDLIRKKCDADSYAEWIIETFKM